MDEWMITYINANGNRDWEVIHGIKERKDFLEKISQIPNIDFTKVNVFNMEHEVNILRMKNFYY